MALQIANFVLKSNRVPALNILEMMKYPYDKKKFGQINLIVTLFGWTENHSFLLIRETWRILEMKPITFFFRGIVIRGGLRDFQRHKTHVFALSTILLISGCATIEGVAGFGTAGKTAQLRLGMKYDQVEALLGAPKSSQTLKGQQIVRWSLHEYGKGWVPYDMVFDSKKKTLISWSANEKEYLANQQKWKSILGSSGNKSGRAQAPSSPDAAVASDASDTSLMRQMSATYYSFSSAGGGYSGGTERRVVLCPNGRYNSGSESGYSAGAGTSGAWGSASQRKGQGTWRIVGNAQRGTLTMISSDGTPTEYRYQSCGQGCYYFGNTKFAVEGPARCP
jgi:hypothetical protein